MSASFFNLTLGKIQQFHKILVQGGVDDEMVDILIKYPHLVKGMVQAAQSGLQERLFGHFRQHLHDLEAQLVDLRTFNNELSEEEQAPAEWFEGVDTSSDHTQQVYDLEVLFVARETLQETWDYNKALFKKAFPWLDEWTGLKSISSVKGSQAYAPGLHRIRINLVDFWRPGRGQSARHARYWVEDEAPTGKRLAGAEVLAAYLSHPELVAAQEMGDFPGAVLAGLHVTTVSELENVLVLHKTRQGGLGMYCLMESQRYEHLTTPTILSVS